MALSGAHISAKAADSAKLFLLNKCKTYPLPTVAQYDLVAATYKPNVVEHRASPT